MKKLFSIIFMTIFLFACVTLPAMAAWEITASWTASAGPNLEKEELYVGDEVIHIVSAGGQTSHVFILPELNGEVVKVVSYNTAGVRNEGYVLGTLEPIAAPADATSGALIIRWKQ